MNSEKLSARQLRVAVLTGGLSAGAAAAGMADWRWLLACVPLGIVIGWLLLRRVGGRPLNPLLQLLYPAWGLVLMTYTLDRTAKRLLAGSGGQGSVLWPLALLTLPLLWMGWRRAAAFFRAAEILWLGTVVTVAAILLLGLTRIDWRWTLEPAGGWQTSLGAGTVTLSTGLVALPYLYKVEEEPGSTHRGLVWLGALGLLSAALAALTAGLLSPAVAALLDEPFFAAAGLLGDSARLEGLVSALWLLPDLTLVGLLSRSWGEKRWPALGVLAALGLAASGMMERLPEITVPAGCLALAVLTAVLPPDGNK